MTDISVKGLVKAFDQERNVLDGLDLDVTAGEHIGILGRNGGGKTTFFRILAGELTPDEGTVSIASGKRLGLISQIPVYPPEYTAEDVLKTAHRRVDAIAAKLERLQRQMETDHTPALLTEYDRLQADFERLGGYETERQRNMVANGLEIPMRQRMQLFDSLSGGEKTRLNLARLILEDTDILLLDEPTNHLDLHATEWLEDYVCKFRGTVLAISHDRYFLDRIAQRTVEIENGRAVSYSGNYSFFVTEKRRRCEEQRRAYEKSQRQIKQLQEAADNLHLWAFMGNDKLHKRAFSMEKRIARLQTAERPQTEKRMKAKFSEQEFFGDEVLVLENVSKAYEGKQLFSGLELMMTGGERIALIGDNGTGKSTLLRILMGQELPDAGFTHIGPQVKIGYLPQVVTFQDDSRSLLDTMLWEEKCDPQTARDRLGQFLFSGEDVFKPVSALSGGERSRLKLCMLMRHDVNLIILDEPTNHLDIASREWMEDALSGYGEALLFVSHDRYFIEKFATRIWELKDGGIVDYRGGFSEYREYCKRMESVERTEKAQEKKKSPKPKPKRTDGKAAEKQLARLEREIAKTEAAIAELDRQAAEDYAADYEKLMEISEQREALDAALLEMYEQWENQAQ